MNYHWNDRKSITLTRVVVATAILGSAIMTISGPWLTRWMVTAHALPPRTGPVLLVLGYLCAVLAFGMLFSLYKFLRRIEADFCARQRHSAAAHQLVLRGRSGALPACGGGHLPSVCVFGRGSGVYGAHRPGAEKRF